MGVEGLRPNGEAQPPADGDGCVERYSAQHETAFQNGSDLAGRLERNVGPPEVELSGPEPQSKQCSPLVKHDTQQAGDDTHLTHMLIRMRQTKVHQTLPFRPACICIHKISSLAIR